MTAHLPFNIVATLNGYPSLPLCFKARHCQQSGDLRVKRRNQRRQRPAVLGRLRVGPHYRICGIHQGTIEPVRRLGAYLSHQNLIPQVRVKLVEQYACNFQ